MMLKQFFIVIAFGTLLPNAIVAQDVNRIAVQSGVFNCFFDGRPIVSGSRVKDILFDSKGIVFTRRMNKSQISLEYMKFSGAYGYTLNFGSDFGKLQPIWKNTRYISGFYQRFIPFNKRWTVDYGIGVTYFWGTESYYHRSWKNFGWTESYASGFGRQSLGVNVRTGIEYTPLHWLTVFSHFNFMAVAFEENSIRPSNLYEEKYGMKNIPNKYTLSWRFGVGVNFGKVIVDTVEERPKNRASFQWGLLHSFFDNRPVMNINYRNKYEPFRKLMYNSYGAELTRQLNSKNNLTLGFMYLSKEYWNVEREEKIGVKQARHNTFSVTYERNVPLSAFNFTYGGGVDYRFGREIVIPSYSMHLNYINEPIYEPIEKERFLNDFGVNVRSGFEYTPRKHLTVFSKVDLIGFLFVGDQKTINEIRNDYGFKAYPKRFDLSWRCGIGYNF